MSAWLNGRVSSMSASAGDIEPGTPLDNEKEDICGPICTGETSKHVSKQASLINWQVYKCHTIDLSMLSNGKITTYLYSPLIDLLFTYTVAFLFHKHIHPFPFSAMFR